VHSFPSSQICDPLRIAVTQPFTGSQVEEVQLLFPLQSIGGKEQVPVEGLQAAWWQRSGDVQLTGVLEHTPWEQESIVQLSLSSQFKGLYWHPVVMLQPVVGLHASTTGQLVVFVIHCPLTHVVDEQALEETLHFGWVIQAPVANEQL
jgi:hypothetical protein